MTRCMLAALLITGCGAHAAEPAARPGAGDRAAIDAIALCKTTEAGLRDRLGAPTRDGRLHDARVLSWILSEDDVIHYLAVMLDAAGVVVDLYWDLPTEIPWTPTDQCGSAAGVEH